MAKQNPSREHERLVKALVEFLLECGYEAEVNTTICLGNHRPDVLGVSTSGERIVGEAKTVGDLLTSHTVQQLQDYVRHGVCCLIVPCQALSGAHQLIGGHRLWGRVLLLWLDPKTGTPQQYSPLLFPVYRHGEQKWAV